MVDLPDYVSARPDTGMLFYVRRVPKELSHIDKRGIIRQTLKTRDVVQAGVKAMAITQSLEAYWGALQRGEDATTSWDRYLATVALSRSFGFTYRTLGELVDSGLNEDLANRLDALDGVAEQAPVVEAIVGGADGPDIRLSTLYSVYAGYRKLHLASMSPRQLKHHEGQRKRALSYLIDEIGDKALANVTRADVLRYRQWWVDKVQAEELTVEAPNKAFSNISGMLTVIDDALHTDYGAHWTKLQLKATPSTKAKKRPPYPLPFIQDRILQRGALDGLNFEARMIIYLMVETGLRPSEICSLRREYIVLDHEIPHIAIEERGDRLLKSDNAARSIPLVGCSLWAAKQCPEGFPRYFDNADSFSAATNKFLMANGLRPSPRITVYSIRHSFQDRLTKAKTLDRVQVDLMGHAFDREKYGDGAALEAKLEVLDGMKFRWAVR